MLPTSFFGSSLDKDVERLFGSLMPTRRQGSAPAMNVLEDEHAYVVELEVPGFTMDELEILVHDGELSVKGSRVAEETEAKRRVHVMERRAGGFQRTLRLPVDLDVDIVRAQLAAGVLTVTLPKADVARPRKVAVQAA